MQKDTDAMEIDINVALHICINIHIYMCALHTYI